jgi:hypothetical protein
VKCKDWIRGDVADDNVYYVKDLVYDPLKAFVWPVAAEGNFVVCCREETFGEAGVVVCFLDHCIEFCLEAGMLLGCFDGEEKVVEPVKGGTEAFDEFLPGVVGE